MLLFSLDQFIGRGQPGIRVVADNLPTMASRPPGARVWWRVGREAAATSQPEQDHSGCVGQVQGGIVEILAGIKDEAWPGASGTQAGHQSRSFGGQNAIGILQRMHVQHVHERGSAILREGELGDPLKG